MARTVKKPARVSKVTITAPKTQPTTVELGPSPTLADLREWFLCIEALTAYDDDAVIELSENYVVGPDKYNTTAEVFSPV